VSFAEFIEPCSFVVVAFLNFQGLLLIFVRRPYDIGDRIATSDPSNETDPNGSSTWYVDKVTLFSTTVRFAATNEVATYSNGSLAVLRIINANRSPKACISIAIKFGLETLFGKIAIFREAVEKFVKARPR
jgi:small-conductance mechanosensitive channel